MPALCMESGFQEPVSVSCVTAAPLLKKMKVLKKFRRRMGLVRSESPQLPPLLFHQVCGENVRIECGGRVARRVESFCKGISFSNRPVRVGERIYVKLLEISSNWSGVIRFGFTSQDPVGLRDALPKYACPDLTSKPGYWAKALSERFAEQGLILFYSVTSAGDVHFGINGEEKGVFFTGVETRSPLWTIIDVYGNSTGVEFLDPLAQLNNRVRIVNNDLRPASTAGGGVPQHHHQSRVLPQPPPPTPPLPPSSSSSSPSSISNIQQRPLPLPAEVVDTLQPSMAQLALSHHHQAPSRPAPLPSSPFTPFPFHHVKGRHVLFSVDRTIAFRLEAEYSHGYVFTHRPLLPGERFVIRIQETEPVYVGALAFGLTAANPAGLEAADLPEDCDLLLDRPEYWVVSKDVASSPIQGDELTFELTPHGQVTYSKNGGFTQTLMHVDHSLQLWAFFDVYGNTKKIKMLGSIRDSSQYLQTVSRRANNSLESTAITTHHHNDRPALASPPPPPPPLPPPHNHSSLVVNLPPSPPRVLPPGIDRSLLKRENSAVGTLPLVASPSGTYVEPVSSSSSPSSAAPIFHSISGSPITTAVLQGHHHECTVCYEKPVDSVLYMCGHMCMCYECALQQWRGRGGGHCPICRAPIRDVIRTYRS